MSSACLFIWLLLFFPKGFNCHQLREGFPDHSTQKKETLTILRYSTQHSWKIHNSFTSDFLKFICQKPNSESMHLCVFSIPTTE
jgi:hypothetical protein